MTLDKWPGEGLLGKRKGLLSQQVVNTSGTVMDHSHK